MQFVKQHPLTHDRLVDILGFASGIGWILNYILMAYTSFRDETYSMSILPLCCNIAWEFVYGVLYPSSRFVRRPVILSWLVLNCLVMFAAVKYSPNDWAHAPLVQRHLPLLFGMGIIACTGFHLALIQKFDLATAFLWSARTCQVLLSIGGLFQLLCRGDTRGASWILWYVSMIIQTCTIS
jgi:paspaline synthase